jgi:multisubunit Na+/H+ antiporter MnhB subunit
VKLGGIAIVTVIVLLMILYEWPKINSNQKKEKVAFAAVAAIGTLLAILLIFIPDMPNPSQLVEWIYKPLGKLLEQ